MKAIIIEGSAEEITAFIKKTQGRGKSIAAQVGIIKLDTLGQEAAHPDEAGANSADSRKPVSLNIKEAAKVLGVGETTMRELARQSGFPSFKVGNCVLIAYDGLRQWAQEQPCLQ